MEKHMPSLGSNKGWCVVIVINLHKGSKSFSQNNGDEDEKTGCSQIAEALICQDNVGLGSGLLTDSWLSISSLVTISVCSHYVKCKTHMHSGSRYTECLFKKKKKGKWKKIQIWEDWQGRCPKKQEKVTQCQKRKCMQEPWLYSLSKLHDTNLIV